MCYSAQVYEQWRSYCRQNDCHISIDEFAKVYGARIGPLRRPKAMDAIFANPESPQEAEVKALIDARDQAQDEKWEQELFKQKKRLADAERSVAAKGTKKAEESKRIAGEKIETLLRWLGNSRRTDLKPRDARIFPMWYAPVLIWQDGKRVLMPMRYHCRPAGKPAFYDTKFPGLYNARRDNLERFWKGQFGHTHGIMLATAFYENVSRHRLEQRELRDGEKEENVRLEFRPQPEHLMLVACLWSRWTGADGEELLSFAAITDEPPPEVAAAGHDRCIIPIEKENMDDWLQPGGDLKKCHAILDDRERPYYEHRMAA